jgi:EmrB/QacA subfamily drug resistance transporter
MDAASPRECRRYSARLPLSQPIVHSVRPGPDRGADPLALQVTHADAPPSWRERFLERLESEGRYPSWVLFAALAGMFATTFPVTILTVSLSSIATEFGTSETMIAWVVAGPMLLSAIALPLLGKLGDLRGHRRVFLLGFGGATLVAGLTATAWSAPSLIGFRTLSAVLGGATQPTAMALIFSVYPKERRVRAMGWWSMTTAAAPALGLIAGGPLVDWLGWRVVFIIQALLSAVALGVSAIVLRETPRQQVRFDFPGAISLAIAVAAFMFSLGWVRELGPTSPQILAGFGLGCAGLVAFVRIESRSAEPLIPLSFFAERNFSASILSNSFMASAYMGAFVIAPFVLLQVFEFSITVAAGIMLTRTLSLTLGSPLGGTLGLRLGLRPAALIGAAVMTGGMGLMAVAILAENLPLLGLAFVLQGLGHGLGLPSLTSAMAAAVPERDLGIASAANRLTAQTGASFGITLLSLVYGGTGEPRSLALAFVAATALSALSFLSALGMARRRTDIEA